MVWLLRTHAVVPEEGLDLIHVKAQDAADFVEWKRVARDQAIGAGFRDGETASEFLDVYELSLLRRASVA